MVLADTMKMIRRTRKMSVSGVMLISAKIPPSFSSSGTLPRAIAGLLPAVAPQRLEIFFGEELELDGIAGDALIEVVVDDHRLDGDGDAERGGHERVSDAGSDDGQAAAGVLAER